MPIIRTPIDDPSLFYHQGEQLRRDAMATMMQDQSFNPLVICGDSSAAHTRSPLLSSPTVMDTEMLQDGIMEFPLLGAPGKGKQIRANACICPHFGAIIDFQHGLPIFNTTPTHTGRWALSGVTKDSTGSPLGNCRVIAFETGRMSLDQTDATVGETISDGSGNYSIETSLNGWHQLTAYLPGSPDVAGITRNDVTPSVL